MTYQQDHLLAVHTSVLVIVFIIAFTLVPNYAITHSAAQQSEIQKQVLRQGARLTNKLGMKNLFDANLLIGGYICQNTLVYARIGGGFGFKNSLKTTGEWGTGTYSKSVGGLSAGLGAKIDCSERVSVGFDYTVNYLGKTSYITVNDNLVKTHRYETKNQHCHLVMFSVGFRLVRW